MGQTIRSSSLVPSGFIVEHIETSAEGALIKVRGRPRERLSKVRGALGADPQPISSAAGGPASGGTGGET